MHSKAFLRSIKVALKITSFFGCTPFQCNYWEDRLLFKRNVFKLASFAVQLVVMHIFMGHLFFQFWHSKEVMRAQLSDSCVHIFYALCWIGFTAYKRNFWKKGREICWLYNQVSKINGYTGTPKNRSAMVEQVIISWLPSQLNCILGTMALFLHGQKKPQFVYSYIAEGTDVVFCTCFMLEFINIVAGASSVITEFYLHAFCIRSFTLWTNRMSSIIPGNANSARDIINEYHKYQILLKEFRNCFGKNIELMKSSFILCSVVLNFVLIRWHGEFNAFTITPILTCCFIVQTNPPFLYSHAYQVYEDALLTRRNLQKVSGSFKMTEHRRYLQQAASSLCPLKVSVANMYFLDRTMVPLFLHVVVSYTLSLLILFPAK